MWSVLASFALSTVGIVLLKQWESATPAEAQFGASALQSEAADVAAEAAEARRLARKDTLLGDKR
jgi:hypothetical protein